MVKHLMDFDFKTHSNYIECLSNLSNGIKLNNSYSLQRTFNFSKSDLNKKINLINCFKKSIDDEYASILTCPGFSEFNNYWISTKSYYLLYHMWTLV